MGWDEFYDFRKHGDRRRGERRRPDDRRGLLRWDPAKRERRSGKDRRRATSDSLAGEV
jgi:hypothetical protein